MKTTIKTCTQCHVVYEGTAPHLCAERQTPPAKLRVPRPYAGMLLDKKYRLINKLGEGGMGSVYRAQRLLMNDIVAIKFMRAEVMADLDIRQRFYQEAKVAARMKHANVVTVYDCGETSEGLVYLVMEMLEGQSLGEMLNKTGALELDQVIDIGIQICEALRCMLEHNVIHRDLKPDNIMLVPEAHGGYTAKVVDFGVAKVLEADAHLTRVQSRIGSPVYSSPEQYLGKPVDHRTDLYGLGVIFYECLTGNVPFEALTQDELLAAIVHKVPPRLDKKISGFTTLMADLVHWLLAKDPNDRPRNAMEVAKCLETLRDSKKTLQILWNDDGLDQPASESRRAGYAREKNGVGNNVAAVRGKPGAAYAQPAGNGSANFAGMNPRTPGAAEAVFRPRPIRKRIKKKLRRIAKPVLLAATVGIAGFAVWGLVIDPLGYAQWVEAVRAWLPWSNPAGRAPSLETATSPAPRRPLPDSTALAQKDTAQVTANVAANSSAPPAPASFGVSAEALTPVAVAGAATLRSEDFATSARPLKSPFMRSAFKNDAGTPKAPVRTVPPGNSAPANVGATMGANMILVKETVFERGDISGEGNANERPAYWVRVGEFWISKYEVTNYEYLQFVEATGRNQPEWRDPSSKYHYQFGSDNFYKKLGTALYDPEYPIVGVSWYDAQAYCEWKTQQSGMNFRLPTEAEWELAARGGDTKNRYSWGNGAPQMASGGNVADEALKGVYPDLRMIWRAYNDNFVYTSPVGKFGPNAYNLYDMTGNVWEWCNDWYNETEYFRKDGNNPLGPASGKEKAIRGGSWSDTPEKLRVSFRRGMPPAFRSNNLGFRVVAVVAAVLARKEAMTK